MSLRTLILNVRRVDSNPTSLLFGGLVDLLVVRELGITLLSKDLGDGCRQSRLAVINVALLQSSDKSTVP